VKQGLLVAESIEPLNPVSSLMVMIWVGADGEPRFGLPIKKPRTIANCEDYCKTKWDVRYHQ
jgi:hypothetical protein